MFPTLHTHADHTMAIYQDSVLQTLLPTVDQHFNESYQFLL